MTLAIRDLTNSPATDESTSPGPCHWSNKPPLNATETPFAAVTNALFSSAPRAAGRPRLPLDHAHSTSENRALVTSGNSSAPQQRRASVCGSPAALRSSFIPHQQPSPMMRRSQSTERQKKRDWGFKLRIAAQKNRKSSIERNPEKISVRNRKHHFHLHSTYTRRKRLIINGAGEWN